MFVTNWISTTKIQKISEITNFFRHYFLSRTEVSCFQESPHYIIERNTMPYSLPCFWKQRKAHTKAQMKSEPKC